MKTTYIKQSLIALSLFFVISSCTNDANNPVDEVLDEDVLLSRQLTNPDVTDFLDDYYKTTYTFGDTEEVYEDNKTYEVTEVFVSSTLPIGYVVTEDVTEEFLYFAHFDRVAKKVDAYDIKNNISDLLNVNSEDENGDTILDIDVIEYIKNDPEPNAERKFWGSEESNCQTEYAGNGCYQEYCDYDYFVIWIRVEHLEHIPSGPMECN